MVAFDQLVLNEHDDDDVDDSPIWPTGSGSAEFGAPDVALISYERADIE